jgi:agmatinase
MKKNTNKQLVKIIEGYNPNENGLAHHGIFGLPFGVEESKMILVPVPWEATVSYGTGTADGPKTILDASQQIDLHDHLYPNGWKKGIAMQDIPTSIYFKSKQTRAKTEKYLEKFYYGKQIDKKLLNEINGDCKELKNYVQEITEKFINEGKIVGVVGGEHSVPLGYLETLSKKYKDFGILHIDAHADMREAYQGLEYSHASTFNNALKITNISKIVSVGVRDFCIEELELITKEKKRVSLFTDYEIKKAIFNGGSWAKECEKIVKELPKKVYISFDIDGLMPNLCPNTGAPVHGGFTIDETVYLFEKVIASGRKIIGFDLCEVAKGVGEWDGNVGARVLYKLCLLTLKSNKI